MADTRSRISALEEMLQNLTLKGPKPNATVAELRALLQERDKALTYKNEILMIKTEEIDRLEKQILQLEQSTLDEKKSAGGNGSHRAAVSAAPIQPEYRKVSPVNKPQETAEFLKRSMEQNSFMRRLGSAQISEVAACMKGPNVFNKTAIIIREGDPGDKLYIIQEGRIEVCKGGVSHCKLTRGHVFGELALLYNEKRTATVTALMKCILWSIDRESFQKIMINSGLESQRTLVRFLNSCEKFRDLKESTLNQIADALEEVQFRYGDYIIRQGTKGDTFYILGKGSVKVTQRETNVGEEKLIKKMAVGDYFGERALEGDELRTASVIADDQTGVTCFCLDRDLYNQLIRPYIRTSVGNGSEGTLGQTPAGRELKKINIEDISIVSTLGIGGFGRVELITLREDRTKTYALKKMLKQHIVDTKQQQHICNEREILSTCDSPFICKLQGSVQDDTFLYFLMEACLGGELWTLLRERKAFDESTTRFFVACVSEALSYLHTRNIVFRDLKPENLILDATGYLKLVDFGFAKRLKKGEKTWTFCGTPEYIAPEIIQNKGHDLSCDLWSLGVLIYELHNGSPPFSHSDHMKTYNAVLQGIHTVEFPKRFSRNTERLIKILCRDNARERLGAGPDRLREVQEHRWFTGFNWSALRNRTYPSIPIIPTVKNSLDSSNFDKFPPLDKQFAPCKVDTSEWFKDF